MSYSAIFCLLLCICGRASASKDQKIVTAESGQNVILTCRAPNNNNKILVTEWSRADLKPQYMLLFRDDQPSPDNQHPYYKNRVDLQDRQMKDGDVSLILKNVTINDTGTYECRVVQRVREPMRLIKTIFLSVDPPGQPGGDTEDGGKEDGSVGLIVGLSVSAVLLVAAVAGFLIYRRREHQI